MTNKKTEALFLVDDHSILRTSLRLFLEQKGCTGGVHHISITVSHSRGGFGSRTRNVCTSGISTGGCALNLHGDGLIAESIGGGGSLSFDLGLDVAVNHGFVLDNGFGFRSQSLRRQYRNEHNHYQNHC